MPAALIRAARNTAGPGQSLGLLATIPRQVILDRVIEVGRATWWARGSTPAALRATTDRIVATHPGVDIEVPAVGADPGVVGEGEHCVSITMEPPRGGLVAWTDGDHVAGALGAAMDAAIKMSGADIRAVERVVAEPAPPQASKQLEGRIAKEPQERATQGDKPSMLPVLFLAAVVVPLVVVFLAWYEFFTFDDLVESVAAQGPLGAVVVVVVVGAGVLVRRLRPLPPLTREQVERKTAYRLCTVWLVYLIIAPADVPLETLLAAARSVGASAENLAGGALRPHTERGGWAGAAALRERDAVTLNALEASQLWHLPAADDGDPRYERARYRRIPPAPGQVDRGPIVGYTDEP